MIKPQKWILGIVIVCASSAILSGVHSGSETPYEIASGIRTVLWCCTGLLTIALNETRGSRL